jgi:hypothetical protein
VSGALRRADQRIRAYRKGFRVGPKDWYPSPGGKGSPAGFFASLTRLDPSEWHAVMHEWPAWRALWYMEQRRVQRAFDDLDRA